ncbi:MAG: hypothetical protein IJA61_04835 [Clostridia bacterium]|nr:hypothetical protein [Clostridia bacterium]
MNVKEKLQDFLNNNQTRELWLNRKDFKPTNYDDIIRLIKIPFGRFDYIYGIENIRNNKPTHYSNPSFCGVIDTKDNQLYVVSYNLTQVDQDIKYTSSSALNEKLKEMLLQAYEKFAETVEDDLTEDAIYYNRRNAEDDYYYNRRNFYQYTLGISEKEIEELITFVENPTEYVDLYIKMLELDKNKLTRHIKECKLQRRLANSYYNDIETKPEYHYLRLARKLNASIPENAETVNLFYKLDNGEIMECKFEVSGLNYAPYDKGENLHFSYFNLDKQARDKLELANGKKYDNVYIRNIIKVTYKGKTIYEKEGK